MFVRTVTLAAVAMMMVAMPLASQERGTVEFGALVSSNKFDQAYNMDNAIGFGGRVGTYLHPRLAIEFEGNGGTAARSGGLADRSFRFIDARLLAVPLTVGRASLLVGLGAGHTDANVNAMLDDESYGFHGLLGAKLNINESAAVRLDMTQHWMGGANHRVIKLGLSLYRNPSHKTTTEIRTVNAAPLQRADSVSAAETARLRDAERRLAALRDSLDRNAVAPVTGSNVAALATMLEMINFESDRADLDQVSRAILRDKVPIFKANPDMKIVITGYASAPGASEYNMALGYRRAVAAKAYLVSQGVAEDRIEISTRGENNLLVAGPGEVANAANRRGQFRLLIADPYLVKP